MNSQQRLQRLMDRFNLMRAEAIEIASRVETINSLLQKQLTNEDDVIDAPYLFKTEFSTPTLWVVVLAHFHLNCSEAGHVIKVFDNENTALKELDKFTAYLAEFDEDIDISGTHKLLKDLELWNN